MGYADDTTIYAVIPAAINYWCFKWHMRLNPKKTKSIVVNQSRTIALGDVDLTLGGAEFEE